MAEKVDEDKKQLALAAPSLPQHVTVEKKTTTKTPPAPIPAVELVSVWVLLTAAILLGSFALAFALVHHDIHLPSWMLPRAGGLTAAEMGALNRGIMWSNAALLLPGRWSGRSRRALAYAAFAATVTSHLMLARLFALVLTADLNIYSWIMVYFDMYLLVSGGLRCLMPLLGKEDYAN